MAIVEGARRQGIALFTGAALSVLGLVTVTACAATGGDPVPESPTPERPTATNTQPSTPPRPTHEEHDTMTTIRITVGDQTITAELADNATAQDLVEQLPLNLRFRDFNGVEKIAKLPRPLTMKGVPAGDDPAIDDIGYYHPSRDLVFYYGDVGYFDGIVRIGRMRHADMEFIRRELDGFSVTVERA